MASPLHHSFPRQAWKARIVACLLPLFAPHARAVIFYSTADPTYNTSAPTGTLAGSGWQWVGFWQGCQGVPIAARDFLTARHIGGTVGDAVVYNGVSYTSTAFFDDPASDLRIVQVDESFPSWTPLYTATDEVGKSLVVFGTGDGRGNGVTVNGAAAGWQWGGGRGTLRWGQNTVAAAENGGSYWGNLLYATFHANGGPNEAHLAGGDSGGPMFLNDGAGWKLAGIAAAVDGPFSASADGSNAFDAALFDARGLFYQNNGTWELITGTAPVPTGFYVTRISSRVAWIESIVPPELNATDAPLLAPWQFVLLAVAFAGSGGWMLRRRPILSSAS